MRTLAIGDIHGCYTALTTLAEAVRFQPEDQIIVLGDYIDRGPDSRAVVDWMMRQRGLCQCVFLRGNHEVMILDARNDAVKGSLWQEYGGYETLASYGTDYRDEWVPAVPASHWKFFEETLPYYETDSHIFVHACVDAELELAEQGDWTLYWEFFDTIQPHKSGKKVLCGHTSQRSWKIKDLGHAACIDTRAAMGGWLTCLEVATGEFWQATQSGQARAGRVGEA